MKYLPVIYAFILACITVLSYTQVDLNLTLSSWTPYLLIQNQLTQLGYFNRSLNMFLWLIILALACIFYFKLVHLTIQEKVSAQKVHLFVGISALAGLISYSVFSHDIFNYIFDARIFTKYNLNPYEFKALDFPNDEWIRFMHWTHRTYPYGPTWLLITIIPSFLGFQKLVLTLLLFKLIFVCSYLISVIYIGKIISLYSKNSKLTLIGQTVYALNPLVLIDALISPHLDSTMSMLFLVSLYYWLCKKKLGYSAALAMSVGIKYITAIFIPLFFLKNKLSEIRFFTTLVLLALLIVVAQSSVRKTVQPWYFLTLVSFIPLLLPFYKIKHVIILAIITIFPLWIYLYYLATGEWKGVLWFI